MPYLGCEHTWPSLVVVPCITVFPVSSDRPYTAYLFSLLDWPVGTSRDRSQSRSHDRSHDNHRHRTNCGEYFHYGQQMIAFTHPD